MVSVVFEYVPQPTATTFAFSSVVILLLWSLYTANALSVQVPICDIQQCDERQGGGKY